MLEHLVYMVTYPGFWLGMFFGYVTTYAALRSSWKVKK